MSVLAAAAALLAAFFQPAPPQGRMEAPRIQRIHLRNGDYIEGHVRSDTPSGLEIRMEDGVLLLPKSQVARIEPVFLRVHEPPPAPPPPPSRPGAPASRPKYVVLVPLQVVHSVRFRVDAALEARRRGVIDREDALRRILECGPEGALHLATLLEPLEPELRGLAVQCLSLLKNPATLSTIVKLLESEDPGVRVTAAGLAGMLGEQDAGRRLRPLLKDREPSVRAAAVAALDKLDDPGALEAISPLCADPDPAARAAALEATMGLAQRHQMRESLLWALDRALRWPPKGGEPDILKTVGDCGDPEAWTLAVPHLASPSAKTRAAAAMAIGALGAPEAAKAVLQQMDVELAAEPRIQLAIAAERIKIVEASAILIEWLSEPEEGVKRAALRALRSLSGLKLGEEPAPWKEWWKSR